MLTKNLNQLSAAGWLLAVVSFGATVFVSILLGAWALDSIDGSTFRAWRDPIVYLLAVPALGAAIITFWFGARLLRGLGIEVQRQGRAGVEPAEAVDDRAAREIAIERQPETHGSTSRETTSAHLGEPDLKLAGFQLWVHGREVPESDDLDDGSWLRVTAHCGASGASVWTEGAILMDTDIARFRKQCDAMTRGGKGSASLDPFEPELKVSLEPADTTGRIRVQVEITPDHLTQSHHFEFEVESSLLPGIVQRCEAILETYPVGGSRRRKGV